VQPIYALQVQAEEREMTEINISAPVNNEPQIALGDIPLFTFFRGRFHRSFNAEDMPERLYYRSFDAVVCVTEHPDSSINHDYCYKLDRRNKLETVFNYQPVKRAVFHL
jgi:hypothetical protein